MVFSSVEIAHFHCLVATMIKYHSVNLIADIKNQKVPIFQLTVLTQSAATVRLKGKIAKCKKRSHPLNNLREKPQAS